MFEKVFSRPKPVSQAMEYETDDSFFTNQKPKGTYMKASERKNTLLTYLLDIEGTEISLSAIAEAMGVSQGHISRLLAELISSKDVTREGSFGHYSYTVNSALEVPPLIPMPTADRKSMADKKKAVVGYLTNHQRELLTQGEIAQGSGVTQPQASLVLKELEVEGTIVRSAPTREGTSYLVNSSPNAHLSTEEELQSSKDEEIYKRDAELFSVIDALVWGFVRETRVTDVLAFLTWLERGGKLGR